MIDRAELWVLSRDIVWHNSVWIAYALSPTRELSRYPCSPVLHLNINSILKLWDDQNRTKFWSVLFTCACCTIVRMHSISEAWTYVPLPATLYPYMQATLYPYMLCTSLQQHNNTTKYKIPAPPLLPTTQRHYSPHFSEAWIIISWSSCLRHKRIWEEA